MWLSGKGLVVLCIGLGAVQGRVLQQEVGGQGEEGFLSAELPLTVVATTPSGLISSTKKNLVMDQQALTVSILSNAH